MRKSKHRSGRMHKSKYRTGLIAPRTMSGPFYNYSQPTPSLFLLSILQSVTNTSGVNILERPVALFPIYSNILTLSSFGETCHTSPAFSPSSACTLPLPRVL